MHTHTHGYVYLYGRSCAAILNHLSERSLAAMTLGSRQLFTNVRGLL